jgi:hypothetical protein
VLQSRCESRFGFVSYNLATTMQMYFHLGARRRWKLDQVLDWLTYLERYFRSERDSGGAEIPRFPRGFPIHPGEDDLERELQIKASMPSSLDHHEGFTNLTTPADLPQGPLTKPQNFYDGFGRIQI